MKPLLKTLLLLAGVLAAVVASPVAQAAGLGIAPMRLTFDSSRGFGQVTLTNASQETISVETNVTPWPADAEGQSTRDIVVNPPIATLQPGGRVTLRVALLRRPTAERERAYRLYVTELPGPMAPGLQGIGVRLRMGIPVFIEAQAPKAEALNWRVQADEQGWLLLAHNPGNVHQRVLELKAGFEGAVAMAQTSPYVLPGATTTFRLPALLPVPKSGDILPLQVQTDHGRERSEVKLP